MASRTNARTLSSRVGVIAANGIVSANSNNFALRRARYLSGSSDIVLMISMIVFSISCVDMLLAMYLAVAVSSSSAIGFPAPSGLRRLIIGRGGNAFEPRDGRAAWVI